MSQNQLKEEWDRDASPHQGEKIVTSNYKTGDERPPIAYRLGAFSANGRRVRSSQHEVVWAEAEEIAPDRFTLCEYSGYLPQENFGRCAPSTTEAESKKTHAGPHDGLFSRDEAILFLRGIEADFIAYECELYEVQPPAQSATIAAQAKTTAERAAGTALIP